METWTPKSWRSRLQRRCVPSVCRIWPLAHSHWFPLQSRFLALQPQRHLPAFLSLWLQKNDFPHGIPECGTDALRFALCSHGALGKP